MSTLGLLLIFIEMKSSDMPKIQKGKQKKKIISEFAGVTWDTSFHSSSV